MPRPAEFYAQFAHEDDALLHCFMPQAALVRLAESSPRSRAILRPAQRTDAPILARYLNALLIYLGEGPLGFDAGPRLAADGFGAAPRFSAVIAEIGQEAVGHALFWPVYDTDTGGPLMFLSDLLVEEKISRPGRGRRSDGGGRKAGRGRRPSWHVLGSHAPQ